MTAAFGSGGECSGQSGGGETPHGEPEHVEEDVVVNRVENRGEQNYHTGRGERIPIEGKYLEEKEIQQVIDANEN